MKKTSILLGIVACACGVSSLQATPDSVTVAPSTTSSAKPRHSTIYITSVTAIGSHVPLVVRSYDGSIIPMSPTYAYGRINVVETSSSSDVGAVLALIDPSISFARH